MTFEIQNIETERLNLIAADHWLLRAIISGAVLRSFPYKPASGWPLRESAEVMPMFANIIEQQGFVSGFEFWLIAHKQQGIIIGDAGFSSLPDKSGAVEVGYSIVENHRRNGYATEALHALMGWVFTQPAVRKIIARCDPLNKASVKTLTKAGFSLGSHDEQFLHWVKNKCTCPETVTQ